MNLFTLGGAIRTSMNPRVPFRVVLGHLLLYLILGFGAIFGFIAFLIWIDTPH